MGKHPPDRGKLGTQRSGLAAGGGVPIGLAVEGAKRQDSQRARETSTPIPIERPEPTPEKPQGMSMDKGYDYDEVRELLVECGCTAHIRARGEEAKALTQEAGFQGTAVGSGTHAELDESLPARVDPLG